MQDKNLPPVSAALARKLGAVVRDRNCNGLVDAGDGVAIPSLYRDESGVRPKVPFEVTSDNAHEFAWIFSSPEGFLLKRFARRFGDSAGFVNYFYALKNGKIAIDEIQTLKEGRDGSCISTEQGLGNPVSRECSDFERSLLQPDAENAVDFINENLLIGRHMKAVAELTRRQGEIAWQNATRGANLDIRPTYGDLERLFSADTIETVDILINGLRGKGDERRLKELSFYRPYLIGRWLAREAAPFTDMIAARLSTAGAVWMGENVPFYELDSRAMSEPDPSMRSEIMKLKASLQDKIFNPILAMSEEHVLGAVSRFGISYADYVKSLRNIDDLGAMILAGSSFFSSTDSLYKRFLDAEARRWLGKGRKEMNRQDLLRLFSFEGADRFFPPEIMYPFLKDFMTGLGFGDTEEGYLSGITIDDSENPMKEHVPQTIAVSVPGDIRISFLPSGGLLTYQHLMHEMGHALHFSASKVEEWAFRNLGDRTATETYAMLMGGLMTDPRFLLSYRSFVKGWNRGRAKGDRVPELTDSDIAKITRLGALRDFSMVRRYNYAKLIYESVRVGADEEAMGMFGVETCGVSQDFYAGIMGEAYGVKMEPWDAARYLIDSDYDFYFVDYARSLVIHPQLLGILRNSFGEGWFSSPDAGKWLKETLFSYGHFFTPADLKERFGFDHNDYSFFERELRWKLLAASMLEKGKPLPKRP